MSNYQLIRELAEANARIHALAERLAKLEAASSLPLTVPTVQHSTAVRIATDPTAPAIPDGFALAPGWEVIYGNTFSCRGGGAVQCKTNAALRNSMSATCAVHAVEMGALVPLVPAEPSGTPGKAPTCKPWCGKTYQDSGVPVLCMHQMFQVGASGHPTLPIYCTEACRDHRCPLNPVAPAPQPEARGLRGQIKAVLERYCDGDWSKNQHMVIRCIENDILQILEPLPAEPPRCGGGRSDCFCAARDENASVWCARCANAWCCADEDDPSAECRVEPPAEPHAPFTETEAKRLERDFDVLVPYEPAEPPRFVSGPQPEQRWRAPSEPAPAPQPEAPAGCAKCGEADPTYADANGKMYCRPCARGAPLPATIEPAKAPLSRFDVCAYGRREGLFHCSDPHEVLGVSHDYRCDELRKVVADLEARLAQAEKERDRIRASLGAEESARPRR